MCGQPAAGLHTPSHEWAHLDDGQSWPRLPVPPLRTLPSTRHRCPLPEAHGAVARPIQQPDAPIVYWTHALRRDEVWGAVRPCGTAGGAAEGGAAERGHQTVACGGSSTTGSSSAAAGLEPDLEYAEYLVLQTPSQLYRKAVLTAVGTTSLTALLTVGCLFLHLAARY